MESAVIDTLFLIAAKWPPEYGGPGMYYKRHIRQLEKIARRVRIVAWSRRGVVDLGDASPNVSAIAMKAPRSRLKAHAAGIRLTARLLWETRAARGRCGILFTGGSIGIGWRPVALCLGLAGTPVLVENVLFDADDGAALSKARWRGLTAWAARRLRGFCAVSSGLLHSVRMSFPQAKAFLVPYGVDLTENAPPDNDERRRARQTIGAEQDAFIATSFGAVHERKGQLPLIDAWLGWVEPRQCFGARLYIVGPLSDATYVESIRCRLGLANPAAARTVILVGFSNDVNVFLRASDVYVSAARAEGLPISIVEALAHGVPVICRRLEGVTDDFMHGQAVTPVVNWSADAVAVALDKLSDVEVWGRASHDARTVAEDRFDIEKRLRTIERLLTDKTFETCPSVA